MMNVDRCKYDNCLLRVKQKVKPIFRPIILCKKIYIDSGRNVSVQGGTVQIPGAKFLKDELTFSKKSYSPKVIKTGSDLKVIRFCIALILL